MKATHDERENWRDEKLEKFVLPVDRSFIWGLLAGGLLTFIFTSADVLSRGFRDSLVPEAVGILFTVFVIDQLNKRQIIEQQKQELILQMGSPDNGFALEAVRKLRRYGWLTDGSLRIADLRFADLRRAILVEAVLECVHLWDAKLQRAKLMKANLKGANLYKARLQGANLGFAELQGAKLQEAKLQRADLTGANLQASDFWKANLQSATLKFANLQEAILEDANLQQANLQDAKLQETRLGGANLERAILLRANLQNADLRYVKLEGANLEGANLQGADLYQSNLRNIRRIESANFDTNTTLPNGDSWEAGYDLKKFTNPYHSKFFEPEWVKEQRERETKDQSEG